MKLKELASYLESVIPLSFQEDYDNSGLQIGEPGKSISSALLCLDVTEAVIDEAIKKKYDLVISHHPLIFNRLKNISDKTATGRIIISAIRNNLAIYSAHTNLDSVSGGVSYKMAECLGMTDTKVLVPSGQKLMKLVTFIPVSHFEKVRESIYNAGAGVIGNYDDCGFSLEGTGSFRANKDATPFVGEPEKVHFEKEIRFETILLSHLKEKVISALLESHPYEEVAYDLYALENNNSNVGLGCIGRLVAPVAEKDFLNSLSKIFNAEGIRYSGLTGKQISKVALCGGAGASFIANAIASGADAYVTADLKYHDFFIAENKILLVDMGHYESEKFSVEILKDLIIKKFPKFAVRFSETNTNPINYF
jgi:dinuclear metal center YbgI/SA1388 family protein